MNRSSYRYIGSKDIVDAAYGQVVNRANYPNHVWSYDFVFDQSTDARQLKCLTRSTTRSGRMDRWAA